MSGKHIPIYHDNRVPRATTFSPVSSTLLGEDARVTLLIEDENNWNMVILREHFLPGYSEHSKRISCVLNIILIGLCGITTVVGNIM